MERWEGRVAIVTGAASGNGEAITRALANKGMKVVGVDLDYSQMKALADELKGCKGEVHAVQGNVTKEEDAIRIMKLVRDAYGGVDILVNNAGVFKSFPLLSAKAEDILTLFNVNVVGLTLFTREAVKDMRERGVNDGHIVNINSIVGQRIVNTPNHVFYTASKHAVTIITEGLRRELRDLGTNIRVTSVSPSVVRTNLWKNAGLTEQRINQIYENAASALNPSDVADAVVYAVSTPPHVQVHEVTILPVGDKLQ